MRRPLPPRIVDVLVNGQPAKGVLTDKQYSELQKYIADRENQLRQEIIEAIKDEPLDWPYEGGISLPRIRNKLRAEIREAIAAIQGEPNGLN